METCNHAVTRHINLLLPPFTQASFSGPLSDVAAATLHVCLQSHRDQRAYRDTGAILVNPIVYLLLKTEDSERIPISEFQEFNRAFSEAF